MRWFALPVFFLSAASFALPTKASTPAVFYVDADVLLLRAGPSPDAEVTGRLRVGTAVTFLDEQGLFLEVSVPVGAGSAVGWVDSRYLSAEPVTRASIDAEVSGAPNDAEVVRLLERRVALDSTDAAAWSALRDRYVAADDHEGASWVSRVFQGTEPTWIAGCHQGNAVLLGRVDTRGDFRSVGEALDDRDLNPPAGTPILARGFDSRAVADRLMARHGDTFSRIGALSWSGIRAEGPSPVQGSPFLRPKVAWEYLESSGLHVVLGACPELPTFHGDGTEPTLVYSSQPLAHASLAPAFRSADRTVASVIKKIEGESTASQEIRVASVRLREITGAGVWEAEVELSRRAPGASWPVLLEHRTQFLTSAGETACVSCDGLLDPGRGLKGATQWFRPLFAPQTRAVGVRSWPEHPSAYGGEYGFDVYVARDAHLELTAVFLGSWGC